MMECPREQDVVEAIASGRWHGTDDDNAALRAHVAACTVCKDVAAVAAALREEGAAAWREAQVPSAARVWWRAGLRARQEAARRASQPITVAQGVAGACIAGLAVALVELAWPQVSESLGALTVLKDYMVVPGLLLPLTIALGVCLVLAPVALYLVLSDK